MPEIEIIAVNLVNEWQLNIYNTECAICNGELDDNITISECNHAYHTECINLWLKRRYTCPLCNGRWKELK